MASNGEPKREEEDEREKLMEIVDVIADVEAAGYAFSRNDSLLPELVVFSTIIVFFGVCVQVYDDFF